MIIKNTTKETIDPIILGDNRICLEAGEEIEVLDELNEEDLGALPKGLKVTASITIKDKKKSK